MFLNPADLFGWAIVIVGAIWVLGLALLGLTQYLERRDGMHSLSWTVQTPDPRVPTS